VASDQTSSPSPAVQALERLGSLSLRKVPMEELNRPGKSGDSSP
jgi:hypothetical protein